MSKQTRRRLDAGLKAKVGLAGGFLHLIGVMDWHSRDVLAWRLSNTMDTSFCRDALEDALPKGRPEMFNTDQGDRPGGPTRGTDQGDRPGGRNSPARRLPASRLCAAGAAVAAGAQRARHRTQRRNVLGVVPFVEFMLVFGRNVHPDQHEGCGLGRRRPVSGEQLLALVTQNAFAEFRGPFAR
jgi:hypothetical protein